MSHEKAGKLRERALAAGHAPAHIQAASLAFFILANNGAAGCSRPEAIWPAAVAASGHPHGAVR